MAINMDPTVSTATWEARIAAARRRRQRYEDAWGLYARLHTNAYKAVAAQNDDKLVELPNGDQVKVGALHANCEQTLALLDMPDVGVRATALDYHRELGQEDTHREALVEQGLYLSLLQSGLLDESEEIDPIKRDAICMGHGINYSAWRMVEEEVEVEPLPVLMDLGDGTLQPVIDSETGRPAFEPQTEKRIVWEGVEDTSISPMQFLCDATCKRIRKASWHGHEDVLKLDALKQDPQFSVPDDVEPQAYRIRDVYGDSNDEEFTEKDSVMVINVYDVVHRELLTFIETAPAQDAVARLSRSQRTPQQTADQKPDDQRLILIRAVKYPVRWGLPDMSPYVDLVLIPAKDEPFGISQFEHTRVSALEADKLRTRQANLTRQLKLIVLLRKGRIDKDQFDQALKSPDSTTVEVDMQDEDDFRKLMHEVQVGKLPPELGQQIRESLDNVRTTSGVSDYPFGGADTATESDNQMAIGGARVKRKQRLLMKYLANVAERHRCLLARFAADGESIAIMGEDGTPLTLQYGRAAFEGKFKLEVLPGGGATSISPVRQKLMVEMTNSFLGRFGPQFDAILLRQLLTMTDARDLNSLMAAARQGMGFAMQQALAQQAGGVDGRARATGDALGNYSNGQQIRAATNAINEGSLQ